MGLLGSLLGELQGNPNSKDLCPQKEMGDLLEKQQQFRKHYLFIYLANCSFSEKFACFKVGILEGFKICKHTQCLNPALTEHLCHWHLPAEVSEC